MKKNNFQSSFINFQLAYLLQQLRKLDIFVNPSQKITIENLTKKLALLPQYHRLFNALLDILFRNNLIHINNDKDGRTAITIKEIEIAKIKKINLNQETNKLNKKYPVQTKLFIACLDNLISVLSGRKNYIEIMFPNGSTDLVDNFYQASLKNQNNSFKLISQTVKAFIKESIRQNNPHKINILEIGAGTGITSEIIWNRLNKYSDKISYCHSDISSDLINKARKKYNGHYPFLSFVRLDIEKEIETQNFNPNSRDIIIASNVIHATKNIAATLQNIKRLLKPGGILILNEPTERSDYATLTFGLTSGWWSFEDEQLRIKHSPLLKPETWQDLLAKNGFPKQNIFGNQGQKVILAERESVGMQCNYQPILPQQPFRPSLPTPYQPPSTNIEKKLIAIWQELFGYGQIGINDNFFDLGGDSLKAVEVVERMSRQNFPITFSQLNNNPIIFSLSKLIQENFVDSKTINKGGGPFTAVYDYLADNHLTFINGKKIVLRSENLDLTLFKEAVLKLKQNFSKIIINYNQNKFVDFSLSSDQMSIDLKQYSSSFEITIINNLKPKKLSACLKGFQRYYNSMLIDSNNIQKKYMPMCSHKQYYNCFHTDFLELIRNHNQEKTYYESLSSAFDFACVPNYCVISNEIITVDNLNNKYLGRQDFWKKLGVELKVIDFFEEKKAIDYFKKYSKQGIVLWGRTEKLPFFKLAEEKLNLFSFGKNVAVGNISVFSGSLDRPICHLTNFNYYSALSKEDLLEYWRTEDKDNGYKYTAIKIENINKISPHTKKQLLVALKNTVDEFFANKIIKGGKNENFEKIYFGRQVLPIYKRNILTKNKKDYLPDIVLTDLAKRLQTPFLFLRDLLKDINIETGDYLDESVLTNHIIDSFEKIFLIFKKEMDAKGIKFTYRISRLPADELRRKKFLSRSTKKQALAIIEEICEMQDQLYKRLKEKLKIND